MPESVPMTAEHYEHLRAELNQLKTTERRQIRADLAHARSFGDFSENAELDEAKRAHSALEGRILQLEKILSRAQIVETAGLDQVSVGARVIAVNLETLEKIQFRLGGIGADDSEAIPITPDSPLGRALLGRRAEDEVEVAAPAGAKKYKILAIEFPGATTRDITAETG